MLYPIATIPAFSLLSLPQIFLQGAGDLPGFKEFQQAWSLAITGFIIFYIIFAILFIIGIAFIAFIAYYIFRHHPIFKGLRNRIAGNAPSKKDTVRDVEGIARMIRLDNQHVFGSQMVETVLNFRIERTDKDGNVVRITPVEMRGGTIHGYISEGDMIKITGTLKDGVVKALEAMNLTTGSKVTITPLYFEYE